MKLKDFGINLHRSIHKRFFFFNVTHTVVILVACELYAKLKFYALDL
jgi:hypothetical protein